MTFERDVMRRLDAQAFDLRKLQNRVARDQRRDRSGQKFAASLSLSGTPTHTTSGAFQHMGGGGGTDTWTALYDIRPDGFAAQVDTTADTAHLTIPIAGRFLVLGHVWFSSIAAGSLWSLDVFVDGATAGIRQSVPGLSAGAIGGVSGIAVVKTFTAGQQLTPMAFQNDSASEAYDVTNPNNNYIAFEYLGPSS